MSGADCALPPEFTAPLDNIQVPDDCVSYTLCDNNPGTVPRISRVEAADVLRVIPTNIVFRHLLGAGLPVCSRKERCPGCADSDHKFWLRYMKSYYGHCQNLKDEEFTEHLAFHQHFGIPVDHRRRPDGSSVLMMRSSQYGGYTPEKAAADHGNCCRISAVCVRSPHEPYADVYGVV